MVNYHKGGSCNYCKRTFRIEVTATDMKTHLIIEQYESKLETVDHQS